MESNHTTALPHKTSLYLIKQAIKSELHPGPAGRKGVSASSIKRFISLKYDIDMTRYNLVINRALKRAVVRGELIKTQELKGGVGSFKLPPSNKKEKNHQRKKSSTAQKKTEKEAKKKEENEKETKKELSGTGPCPTEISGGPKVTPPAIAP